MRKINPFVIAALLTCAVSLWGCSQQKTGVNANKLRDLESQINKLEEEQRALQASNEQIRKRLAAAEAQRTVVETQKATLETEKADLTKELETTNADRESLRKQVANRTSERDAAQNLLVQFSKDLQSLAARIESAVNNPAPTANAPIIPASRRND